MMASNFGERLSDEELVTLCKKRLPGDSRPFTALVSRYERRVLATCFRLMGDRQEAKDQAQEVFIRVYRGITRFEERAKFSTWLFQIAVNTCRTALKKQTRRPKLAETPLLTLENLLPSFETAEETAFAQAEVDLINQALDTLNEGQRVILTLRETNDLGYREIAEVLDIGLSTAKMRVMRARLAWQRAYQKLLGEEECLI